MKRTKKPQPTARVNLIFIGNVPEEGLTGSERKARERALVKRDNEFKMVPITEQDIPVGSQLSEQMLSDIRAGLYGMLMPKRLADDRFTPPSFKRYKMRSSERKRREARAARVAEIRRRWGLS